MAREADDDSERLAGQVPCRWQSRSSEGLGLAACAVLRLNERLTKRQWLGDTFQRRMGCASTSDNQRAEVEHAADQRLSDLNALDLGEVDLDGAAANETVLDDDSLGGDGKLGGLDPDVGAKPQEEPNAKGWQEDQAQQDEVPNGPKRRPADMNNTFSLNQDLFYVACHLCSTTAALCCVLGGSARPNV